jgi:hypothetical protein
MLPAMEQEEISDHQAKMASQRVLQQLRELS